MNGCYSTIYRNFDEVILNYIFGDDVTLGIIKRRKAKIHLFAYSIINLGSMIDFEVKHTIIKLNKYLCNVHTSIMFSQYNLVNLHHTNIRLLDVNTDQQMPNSDEISSFLSFNDTLKVI